MSEQANTNTNPYNRDQKEVRETLRELLKMRKINPKTQKGFEFVVAYYAGAYGLNLPAYVAILLTCGRIEDLC